MHRCVESLLRVRVYPRMPALTSPLVPVHARPHVPSLPRAGAYPPAAAADRARPVLGAFYAPLLIASPSPNFVSERAAVKAVLRELGIE